MVFSSVSFLYVFLPTILLIYWITPKRFRNVTLFVGSLLFYFIGEPKYTVLLLISTVVDYTHSLIIERHRGTKRAKVALISSIVINLSMLGFFKYADFIISIINGVFKTGIEPLGISLPIGISFFTFQTMSYTIDVYRNEARPQKNPLNLGTYVALFPQLIAGPIVRYKTISEELTHRTHHLDDFAYGVHRFILGLGKKVLIANTLGELAAVVHTTNQPSVLYYWLGAVAFALQIYYDFSGYSDMAIGLGRMFGFHFLENFNYPYISRSISEFWNRWHMSLGQWFRDYVYIPLGGNRSGTVKWLRNIMIVWLLTGFWHGAGWNFILWGGILGTFIMLEKLFLLKWLEKAPRIIGHVYVVILIVFSFVIFNNDSMAGVTTYFKGMFGGLDVPMTSVASVYDLRSYLLVFIIAMIGATPMIQVFGTKLANKMSLRPVVRIGLPILLIGVLLISTGYLVDASFNPFLYFRF